MNAARYTDEARAALWQSCGGPRHRPGPWGPTGPDGSPIWTEGDDSPGGLGYCRDCPPHLCEDCGQMESYNGPHCACWTDLTVMAPADVKAVLAADGWNVGGDGRLTR